MNHLIFVNEKKLFKGQLFQYVVPSSKVAFNFQNHVILNTEKLLICCGSFAE